VGEEERRDKHGEEGEYRGTKKKDWQGVKRAYQRKENLHLLESSETKGWETKAKISVPKKRKKRKWKIKEAHSCWTDVKRDK